MTRPDVTAATTRRVTHDEAEHEVDSFGEEYPARTEVLLDYIAQQRQAAESRRADVEVVRKAMRGLHPGICDREERDAAIAALDRLAGEGEG